MGKIFYVMGKSSSGKDTIYNRLMKDLHPVLKTIVGYTTRPMRENEVNGREYFFVSEEELRRLEREGKVIECRSYNTVYGTWYYFTVDDEQVNLDRYNYLLIGTLASFTKVADYYGADERGEKQVIPIYINVEDGERLIRAILREKNQPCPGYQEVCRRFLADSEDFLEENIKQAGIEAVYENDDIEKCCEQIKRMIEGTIRRQDRI